LQNREELKSLYQKFLSGKCTDEEFNLLFLQFNNRSSEELIELIRKELDSIDDPAEATFEEFLNLSKVHERIISGIDSESQERSSKIFYKQIFYSLSAAAAVLIIISLGIMFYTQSYSQKEILVTNKKFVHDVVPGGNKAFLTLANGTKLSLTDATDGELAKQAGISIVKTEDGQLVYNVSNTSKQGNDTPLFNTIETPRGGQYQINLPDGSRIWLNAASSLRYPVVFSDNERKVELKGEAYFEIAKNMASPFRVVSNNQIVEVLGTHFNINSYPEEGSVKTTLLEGSVKIRSGNKSAILRPGQQSQVGNSINVTQADIYETVAWKNGKTQFSNADIKTIMRMLSRWYDVEVQYQGEMIETGFGGSVSRSKNISEILKLLELTGDVHFKIEGRRVTVMP
jgi:transmembrane sensor